MVHLILAVSCRIAVEIVAGELIFTIDEMVTQATARVDVQLLTVQATARMDVHGACESAGVNLPWSEMLPRREIVFQPLHPETGPSLPEAMESGTCCSRPVLTLKNWLSVSMLPLCTVLVSSSVESCAMI